jgi:glycosyltransferase involved in cell wall biosynthesis
LRFPHLLTADSRRYYGQVAKACQSADRVIAVSEHTARDLEELLGVARERVRVVYEAAKTLYRPLDDAAVAAVRRRYDAPAGYLLFVGTIEPRKNLDTLLRALAALNSGRGGATVGEVPPLLVVGRPGWLYEETFRLVEALNLRGVVRFLGAASTEDLLGLYNGAVALACPSLYEGFGLPPLEAMACGTPVVCSDTSSLPEVVGDAGLLVPPLDVAAWAEALARVVADARLQAELRGRGVQRAKMFSWRRAASETLEVYREALE